MVVTTTTLHHVPSHALQDRLLAEAHRVLRPGGWFTGSDSRTSLAFRLAHRGDVLTVVDPETFRDRLTAAASPTQPSPSPKASSPCARNADADLAAVRRPASRGRPQPSRQARPRIPATNDVGALARVTGGPVNRPRRSTALGRATVGASGTFAPAGHDVGPSRPGGHAGSLGHEPYGGDAMKRPQLPLYALALAVLIVGLAAVGVPVRTLVVSLAALACPLMMVFMMGGMHGHGHGRPDQSTDHPEGSGELERRSPARRDPATSDTVVAGRDRSAARDQMNPAVRG